MECTSGARHGLRALQPAHRRWAASASARAQKRDITAEAAADRRSTRRFARFFGNAAIQVQVDDTLLADAAAGSDYVKIRSGALFSRGDVDILEAHEGWVHVATSLNGQAQPVARWLGKGPPRTTAVQEGLAALVEIFTFRSNPRRAKKLNDRILAVDKAEDGASFLDVFEWYRTEGYSEEECFQNARRVFRGGLLSKGRRPLHQGRLLLQGHRPQLRLHPRRARARSSAELIPYPLRRQGRPTRTSPILYAHVTDGIVKPPHVPARRSSRTSAGSRSGCAIRASSPAWAARRSPSITRKLLGR